LNQPKVSLCPFLQRVVSADVKLNMPKTIKLPRPVKPISVITKSEKEQRAEELRSNPTSTEKLLYARLEQENIPFEFQQVLHGYIPDFLFRKEKKIVELDGKHHKKVKKQRKHDQHRDYVLKQYGYKTLRIAAWRTFRDMAGVIEQIKIFLGLNRKIKRVESVNTDDTRTDWWFLTEGI
jgi:very-short-patch-repair endonuclease